MMNDDKLKELVMGATFEEDGRTKLKCEDAFRLAAENGVERLDIARICNNDNIRICQCQLGCFE